MSDSAERFDQLMEAMHQLQLESNDLRESPRKLQGGMPMELEKEKTNARPTSINLPQVFAPSSTLSPTPLHLVTSLEPKVSLPNKFDCTRARFQGFINQIKLIVQLQPQQYSDNFRQAGLVGSFSQELCKPSSQHWSKHYYRSYTVFLPFLQSSKQHLGIRTDTEQPTPNSIYYIKVDVLCLFMPSNSNN
jgi:hypothetical protein